MSTAAYLVKKGTPSLWPYEMGPITDPKDPRFQPERLEMAASLTDEEIRTLVTLRQIQPVSVRISGEDVEIVEGVQRWKKAWVINAIVGVGPAYKGPVRAIREAIERIKGTDLAEFLRGEVPNGFKLKVDLYRGTEQEAVRAQTVANEQRHDDPLEVKIRRAHRLAKAGFTTEEIAADFGHPDARTVQRWLKRDPDASRTRKARTKKVRPGPKKLRAAWLHASEQSNGTASVKVTAILSWVLGEFPTAELKKLCPELAGAEI